MPSDTVEPPLRGSMCNLLLSPPDCGEHAGLLAASPRRDPLPPCGSPEWAAARVHPDLVSLITTLLARAETKIDEPMHLLNDELYKDYHSTGSRLRSERVNYERRQRLSAHS